MKHNWTKEKLGECAKIHMEQLIERHFNMFPGKEQSGEVGRIIESYFKIENSFRDKDAIQTS